MPEFEIATDIASRIRELREIMREPQARFARRFGRGWQRVSAWERGGSAPPFSVLEMAADLNHWPLAIFMEGGPRPGDVLSKLPVSPTGDLGTRQAAATLQVAVNEAITDVLRWTAERYTLEQASARAIHWIHAIGEIAKSEARATAEESADLIRALHRQIAILGEGRAAGSPVPPAKAAGGE